jgi:5-methylcytosine-specific restriction endonuclease McrA
MTAADLKEYKRKYHEKHRTARLAKMRAWRLANPDRVKALQKSYYEKHRMGLLARMREWREAHPVEAAMAHRAWVKKNREKNVERIRRWNEDNPTRRRQIRAQWIERHRERHRLQKIDREARRRGAKGRITPAEWQSILLFYGYRCGQCGISCSKLTRDHFIPIARGGSNTRDNIWPLCPPCNSRKHAKMPSAAIPPHAAALWQTGTEG